MMKPKQQKKDTTPPRSGRAGAALLFDFSPSRRKKNKQKGGSDDGSASAATGSSSDQQPQKKNAGEKLLHAAVVRPFEAVGRAITSPFNKKSDDKEREKPSALVDEATDDESHMATIEPDKQLQSMNVVLTKTLRGVSVREWYEACWSEGNRTDKSPFYGPWLVETGKKEVNVEDWTFGEFVGDWDKETYQQKRTVTFELERSSWGTTTQVTHTQYCRVEKRDSRCVLAMTIRMQGIPFADAFYVVLRWVGTRAPSTVGGAGDDSSKGSDLELQLGLFVVFVKQVIVAGKIRSGTTQNTTAMQLDLFHSMKAACTSSAVPGDATTTEGEEEEREGGAVAQGDRFSALDFVSQLFSKFIAICFPFLIQHETDEDDIDDIERTMRQIHEHLRTIRSLPSKTKEESGEGDLDYILEEFEYAQGALDQCLMKLIAPNKESSGSAAEAADSAEPRVSGVGSFFHTLSQPFHKVVQGVASLHEPLLGASSKAGGQKEEFDVNTPDTVLQGMNIVLEREIPNTTAQKLYDVCFSEGIQTGCKPFYAPYLKKIGAKEINVGDWKFATGAGKFTDGWSEDTYGQKRTLTYSIDRKSVMGRDSVVSDVTQKQYCRFDGGGKRLVLQACVNTEGIPFGDMFTVYYRMVVTDTPNGGVALQVGSFVLMLKETMASQKVRMDATRVVTKRVMELYRNARAALVGTSIDGSDEPLDMQKAILKIQPYRCFNLTLRSCVPGGSSEAMLKDEAAVSEHLNNLDTKIQAMKPFLDRRTQEELEHSEVWRYVLSQLELANESLDNIVLWRGDESKGKEALDSANFS